MNWEAIKHIYRHILIHNYKFEYLGGDKYKIIRFYSSGEKQWSQEYKDEILHGKYIYWYLNGHKACEYEYQNGKLIK